MAEEEKLEFLKREEIRTMAKDIAILREIEAKNEKEKITFLKPGEFKKESLEKSQPAQEEKEKALTPVPQLKLKKSLFYRKILIRAAMVLIVVLALGNLSYGYFTSIKPPEETPPAATSTPPVDIPVNPTTTQEIIIPQSLIQVNETKVLEISKTEEMPAVFNQLMEEEFATGSLTRVVFKDTSKNLLSNLGELSQSLQIPISSEIIQKLEDDFTFAIFSQNQGKRITLTAKIKNNEGLDLLLKNLEASTTKEGVFISGEKLPAIVSSYKTATVQGASFRYLTVSKNDLGVCYSLTDGYFVLTYSYESLKDIVGKIKSSLLKSQSGQLFIVGFDGKTLTNQLEEFFKKYRPGGVLLLPKNIDNEERLKKLISDLQVLSLKETGLLLFIAVDQEGGSVSRVGFLTEKTAQSQIATSGMAYQVGLKRGTELKEIGININLAPVLDDMASGDFYYARSFQKTPELSGELAKSLIQGQKEAGILTCVKHFPGYVNISFNPGKTLASVNLPEISQFKKAMEASPELVIASNVIYNDIDASLPFIFSDKGVEFLKSNLGNNVLIVSDALSQNSLSSKYSLKDIVVKPFQAGIDMLLVSGYTSSVSQSMDQFLAAEQSGEVSKEKIDAAVSRVIQLKQSMLK